MILAACFVTKTSSIVLGAEIAVSAIGGIIYW